MKRILAAASLVVLCSTLSFAAGIKNSKHDLSSGNASVTLKSGGATSTDQICIFCHTPHNAIKSVPLWNRDASAGAGSTYKLYSSSSTLSYAKGSQLKDHSISLFCLSCHDGTVTNLGDRVVNNGKQTTGGVTMVGAWTTRGAETPALLGKDLTNDHPVGFVYPDTDTEGRLESAASALTKMNAAKGAVTTTSKAIFFTTGGIANQMECSSCHLVHDSANTFFLRATNTGSQLCLACHKK